MTMRAKCRQAPSCFFLKPFWIESRRRAVPSKKSSTTPVAFGQQVWMFHLPFHFVRDHDELNVRFFRSSSSAAPAAEKWKR